MCVGAHMLQNLSPPKFSAYPVVGCCGAGSRRGAGAIHQPLAAGQGAACGGPRAGSAAPLWCGGGQGGETELWLPASLGHRLARVPFF